MIHKNTSDIDRVYFEVVEQANSIQEGSVIDLSSEADLSAILVDIALPNVIEHIVRLKSITGNKHLKQLLMDGGGGKADNLALQLAIDHRAVGPVGGKVEAWLKEVVRSVMMSPT